MLYGDLCDQENSPKIKIHLQSFKFHLLFPLSTATKNLKKPKHLNSNQHILLQAEDSVSHLFFVFIVPEARKQSIISYLTVRWVSMETRV